LIGKTTDFLADVEDVVLRPENGAAETQGVTAVHSTDIAGELAILRVALDGIIGANTERPVSSHVHLRESGRGVIAAFYS
jgi:hypothetical protein